MRLIGRVFRQSCRPGLHVDFNDVGDASGTLPPSPPPLYFATGQITELATEVLNDATEEGQVSVSSELQVEKKKCAEAERQFLSEKAKNEALEKRVKELEDQLFYTNVENDAIKEKYTGIVSDREQQIQQLNWEIERLRSSEDFEFKNINLGSPPKVGQLSTSAEDEAYSLHNVLGPTKADTEKKANDFGQSVSAVDEEFAELKEYNQRLITENSQLRDSLAQLNHLRDALNASNDQLSNFREKFVEMHDNFTKEVGRVTAERDKLRAENEVLSQALKKTTDETQCQTDETQCQTDKRQCQTDERQCQTDETQCQTDERQCQTDETQCQTDESNHWATEEQIAEMFEQNMQLKTELNEREQELNRLRNDKVLLADITSTDGHSKRPPSDTDSATSNNDWERMGKEEIEVEGVSSSAASDEKEPRRKKSSELRDSSTQTDEGEVFGRNSAQTEQEKEQLSLLRSETEQLQQLLQQKHSECQNYYEKLQEMCTTLEGKSAKLESAEETLRRREKEIALGRERVAKLEGDLQRLREHLLAVEEHSSKDAIAAEERETELRRQIRLLQEKSTTEGTSLVNSLEQYQLQVSELLAKVAQFENDKMQMEAKLTEKETLLCEMNKTLSNLQSVLKELAEDQKMERQKSDAELRSVREELKQKLQTLKETEEAKTNLEDAFANVTHELNLSREHLLSKENLVDELENQLEEMRISCTEKSHYTAAGPSAVAGITSRSGLPVSSHKIDDATLRQLFLSYFTAEKSKQPEIAIVMSRILGYSAEEQSQISEALSKSSSSASSWLFPFSSAPSASPGPQGGLSLTEQFVRFLEQESMANARALIRPSSQSLPVTDSGTFLVGESPPMPTHSSSADADLKSILEQ